MRKDFHVHESHSRDAPGALVEEYCREAEIKGMDEICFTTHLIISGPDTSNSIEVGEIPEYLEEVERAQSSTNVKLRVGLEVDYFPEEERRLESLLDEYPFDFILGSLHYIRGYDIGAMEGSMAFFGKRSLREALNIYYTDWKLAVESGLFDVMAHPDYFRKYLHYTIPEPLTLEDYGSMLFEAVESMVSYGVGVEVNPSGYRHGIGDCYPSLELLGVMKDWGIGTVTVGSDSHRVEDLGSRLEKAVARLRSASYEHICTFEKRRNRVLSLDEVCSLINP
ncbi:histidinol-phosphatase HisJ family protein [Candidatus Bathyarchaeota archaeon]|nr:histidinol-phosphatase HisJ family protein [Candidatus Bathyarchaeota archaeon]